MNLNCLIVEDEPLARNLLVEYLRKVPYLNLVDALASPVAALKVLNENEVDILFLDIQMPEITGITLLKILQKKPQVILTTAYSEYALESYELDVVDYLLKPISFDRFLRAVDKASQRVMPNQITAPPTENNRIFTEPLPAFVFVKDGTKLVKLRWDDILYVEGLKDYVTIYTRQGKIVTLQRLKSLENQLPADKFIRIHHSYIVALEGIDAVYKDKVQLGQVYLPISDTYRKLFKDFIDRNHIQPD